MNEQKPAPKAEAKKAVAPAPAVPEMRSDEVTKAVRKTGEPVKLSNGLTITTY